MRRTYSGSSRNKKTRKKPLRTSERRADGKSVVQGIALQTQIRLGQSVKIKGVKKEAHQRWREALRGFI